MIIQNKLALSSIIDFIFQNLSDYLYLKKSSNNVPLSTSQVEVSKFLVLKQLVSNF